MKMLLFVLTLLMSSSALAKTSLTVLVGLDKPPYINLSDQSGFELDLIRLVLKKMGSEAQFLHVPNARLRDLLLEGKADIATLQKVDPSQPLFYSTPYIQYQNVVASLKIRSIQIRRMMDIQPYTVVAFHNARRLLGKEFETSVNAVESYQELANQSQQVQMLLMSRCDLVIADSNILNYYLKLHGRSPDELDFARLFAPALYHAAFRNDALRARFDRALADVVKSADYQELQLKYFGQRNQLFSEDDASATSG
ncbi:transporter substrate-binding domain-containing protein [Rheinheimera sp.]|uniref:substrate-binding periplasmic protein n=1 Tax=Rheinheimera sp. TaxID=1869214 RepID=UPI00307DE1E3